MASITINGDTSGGITLSAPAVAGSNTQTLVAATGTLAPLISETAKSATGTSVDFTGIPSWAKRITILFSGVSTNYIGGSNIIIQLGDSGGLETTGYTGSAGYFVNAGASGVANFTSGFGIFTTTAANSFHGAISILLVSTNLWAASGTLGRSDGVAVHSTGGTKTLSDTLDRIRITTVNGTDTFDAGTINILYE